MGSPETTDFVLDVIGVYVYALNILQVQPGPCKSDLVHTSE